MANNIENVVQKPSGNKSGLIIGLIVIALFFVLLLIFGTGMIRNSYTTTNTRQGANKTIASPSVSPAEPTIYITPFVSPSIVTPMPTNTPSNTEQKSNYNIYVPDNVNVNITP